MEFVISANNNIYIVNLNVSTWSAVIKYTVTCFSPEDNNYSAGWRAILYLKNEPVQSGAQLLPSLSILQVRIFENISFIVDTKTSPININRIPLPDIELRSS